MINYEDTQEKRHYIKALTKSLYDFQNYRIRTAGRLNLKADKTAQKDNGTKAYLTLRAIESLQECFSYIEKVETMFSRKLTQAIKEMPEWTGFLADIRGLGPLMAAVLISEIDIEKATTVSKIWQFAGLNSGSVKGKKIKNGSAVETNDLIRGDKPARGYILPYNKFLKTKLMGVLSICLIRTNSPYRKYYDGYKSRLENSEQVITGKDCKWCETSALHRDVAARRYMIKMFLKDYYIAVRSIYGMEIRNCYQEEYLGHIHKRSGQEQKQKPK